MTRRGHVPRVFGLFIVTRDTACGADSARCDALLRENSTAAVEKKMAPKKAKTSLSTLEFDSERYVSLLSKLVGEAEKLQNDPPNGLLPQEDNCSQHVLAALDPYLEKNSGPLKLERVSYAPGRGNVVIIYPGETAESVAFVGCHMDVVPANPENWKRDPFKLTVEGDELHGRGATDCLGHVAIITELFTELAIKKPKLRRTVTAVLIANVSVAVGVGAAARSLLSGRARARGATSKRAPLGERILGARTTPHMLRPRRTIADTRA